MLIAITKISSGPVGASVSIMNVIHGEPEEALEKWKQANPGSYVSHREIGISDVPVDRTFRNAWKPDLTVDMVKAREIKRGQLRAERAPLLAALDIAYQRADEQGDIEKKRSIAAQKQALRDVTQDPAIEAAQTPEKLKAVTPEALK